MDLEALWCRLRSRSSHTVGEILKPVRSLENFKRTSPIASPERWMFPSRTGAPMASPPTRFFLPGGVGGGGGVTASGGAGGDDDPSSQETQNLLLQSPDDVFSSPPVPPRIPAPSTDLFGTVPFVIGGGHSENGDPLFLVANRHSVDIVKLSPSTCSPRRKRQGEDTEDLIRLDSTSDEIDDFDPLKTSPTTSFGGNSQAPLSVSNPLYTYENHSVKQNGSVPNVNKTLYTRNDQDLLQEYGLDFNNFSRMNDFDPFTSVSSSSSTKVNSKSQWTKFE